MKVLLQEDILYMLIHESFAPRGYISVHLPRVNDKSDSINSN